VSSQLRGLQLVLEGNPQESQYIDARLRPIVGLHAGENLLIEIFKFLDKFATIHVFTLAP